jgi:hypothetical protein
MSTPDPQPPTVPEPSDIPAVPEAAVTPPPPPPPPAPAAPAPPAPAYAAPAAAAGLPAFPDGKPMVDAQGRPASPKSRLAAALLCWFLGFLGIHRFYVGKAGTGVLMIVTLGGLGVWVLIDFIMILIGSFRDKQERYLSNW